jgi:hypothetical protein
MVTEMPDGTLQELFVTLHDTIGGIGHQFTVWPSGQINEDF